MVPCVGLQCVVVVLPDHTHFLNGVVLSFFFLSFYLSFFSGFTFFSHLELVIPRERTVGFREIADQDLCFTDSNFTNQINNTL